MDASTTGVLMKHFRHLQHGARSAEEVAATFSRKFGSVERLARIAVGVAGATSRVLGDRPITALTNMARAVVSRDLMPGWLPNMPSAAKARLPKTRHESAVGVYFTACVNRIFGRMPGQERKPSLQEAMIAISERAGMPLWIPEDIGGHCCATIWHSKGYIKGNAIMANLQRRRKPMALERQRQVTDHMRREALVLVQDNQRNCRVSHAREIWR